MKILISVHNLTNGGAERVAVEWARGFAEVAHEVAMVLCCPEDTPVSYFPPTEVKIFNTYPKRLIPHLNSISVFFNLRKVLKEYKPDLFISVAGHIVSLLAPIGLGIDCIKTEHNAFERPDSAPMSNMLKFNKFFLNRFFKKVTMLTTKDTEIAKSHGVNGFYLPNPLAFEPIKQVPTKKRVLLAAGRLDVGHTKGFDILIKAFGMSSHSGWTLQIAGAGAPKDIEKYTLLAEECGVKDEVVFLGYIVNPIQIYRDAEIFVLSSRYEGFGLVLIEAMSQGCACIACDYGGRQKEIVGSEDNALCCETENVEALAVAMNKLMSDDNLRHKLQVNAIERSKAFTNEKIMERWMQIIKA